MDPIARTDVSVEGSKESCNRRLAARDGTSPERIDGTDDAAQDGRDSRMVSRWEAVWVATAAERRPFQHGQARSSSNGTGRTLERDAPPAQVGREPDGRKELVRG